ncbi:MAG TPA: hypothetical protein VK810_02365 [Dongiaceae bacterium]|jgi:hypothetical protein|nr:hypothetical protein [Dongiaceae bacterium]
MIGASVSSYLSSLTEAWIITFAAAGGVFVFVGLLLEKFSEKKWYKNTNHFRCCEFRKSLGEWFVLGGVFVEIAVAVLFAINDWEMEIWNGKISEISAQAFIVVKDSDAADLDSWGSPSMVASLILCESELESSMDASTFPPLSAATFSKMGTVLFGGNTNKTKAYSLAFQSQGYEAITSQNEKSVKEISKFKIVRLYLKFLPKNSEIMGGNVNIVVNGNIRKSFQIFSQIDTNAMDGTKGFPYIVIATNSISR